jgi:hypothetical protein
MMRHRPASRSAARRAAPALFGGALLAVFGADPAPAACLKASADGQAIEGRLVTGRFRDAAERREEAYILELTAPACLEGTEESDQVNSTRRIHVYPHDEKLGAAMRRLVGKTVRIKGNPFGQHTAHHHAPIVMEVADIAPR